MRYAVLLGFVLSIAATSCAGGDGGEGPDPTEPFSGGAATVFDTSADAYSHVVPGIERDRERTFFKGRALFRDPWVTAPSSTQTRDGLGPLFNARACEQCHIRDGRGRPPLSGEVMVSMLLRLSIPGEDAEAPLPDPVYGGQFQPQSVLGVPSEGRPVTTYEVVEGRFGDGTAYALRKPSYTFEDLGYGPLHDDVQISARVAPPMIGLGLLEAIAEDELRARADPEDIDGDGISGRVNEVPEARTGATVLGRFGWKAGQPSLLQQSAGAFLGDIGITSSVFPDGECTSAQASCVEAISGGEPELLDTILDNVVGYGQLLAVPARRDVDDPTVRDGKRLFEEAGCASCHVTTWTTAEHPDAPELDDQKIHPYTDLLLHDMGDGLADHRPEHLATGTEWRTPPLWGLGLLETVNGHTLLLHDGRARTIEEAILWHGGEAEAARRAYVSWPAAERASLLAFLESL